MNVGEIFKDMLVWYHEKKNTITTTSPSMKIPSAYIWEVYYLRKTLCVQLMIIKNRIKLHNHNIIMGLFCKNILYTEKEGISENQV